MLRTFAQEIRRDPVSIAYENVSEKNMLAKDRNINTFGNVSMTSPHPGESPVDNLHLNPGHIEKWVHSLRLVVNISRHFEASKKAWTQTILL